MKKESLRKQVFESALQIVEKEGMEELSARKLAELSSCALGSIYNAFGDLEDLHFHINGTVLSRLYDALGKTAEKEIAKGAPLLSLFKELGVSYLDFSQKNRFLWKALFEHLPNQAPPKWYAKRAQEGIYHLCQRIGSAYGMPERKVKRLVGFFWSSIHGVAAILLNRKMEMVSELFPTDFMLDYIEYSLSGLFATRSDEVLLPKRK